MKIIIGNWSGVIEDVTFEKIIGMAGNTLERLKREEGFLPPTEIVALKTIRELQWRLSEKNITKATDL